MKNITIGNLQFRNPVITASGTFGMGDEFDDFIDFSKIGGITLKTVTKSPRSGNLPPRILETPCGLLNSIGLENMGFEYIYKSLKKHDTLLEFDTNIIFSIAGETIDDYIEMAKSFAEIDGVNMIELNLSCPNIHGGGSTFDSNPKNITAIVEGVAVAIDKPFTTKLSPNNDIVNNAKTAEAAGSTALTISNTFLGIAIDTKTGKPIFKNIVAGFSGPAVKPLALYNVYRVAQVVSVPIIASGGISCIDDAVEFLHVGATLLSIGTMNFIEPGIAVEIADKLEER